MTIQEKSKPRANLRPVPPPASSATPSGKKGPWLNLGCGARFHPGWLNADLHPVSHLVKRQNVLHFPWPWADAAFEMVYCSHLLEHLPGETVPRFLAECRRVLLPGGVLRLVVPDLEQIARLYLQELDRAAQGDENASARHRWMTLELLDQLTRDQPGGRMPDTLHSDDALRPFALARLGVDAAGIVRTEPVGNRLHSFWQRLKCRLHGWLLGSWRERLIRRLLGREYACLQVGRFRQQGEVHRWMYDRVSLAEMLNQAGFTDIRLLAPNESHHPDWHDFALDLDPTGLPAKPDSLCMEGRRF